MTVRRPPPRVGGALSCVGLVGLLMLSGCTAGNGDPATPAAGPTPSTGGTAASSAAVPTTPASLPPGSCNEVVTSAQVAEALGVRLPGGTSVVVGEPEPGIGRTGRLTCGFGVTAPTVTTGAGNPLLEVSLFTYADAQAAADRAETLAAFQRTQGVRVAPAAVTGADALVFASAADVTVTATVGDRTWALTLVPGLLDEAGAQTALEALATVVVAVALPPDSTTSPSAGGPTGTSSTPTG